MMNSSETFGNNRKGEAPEARVRFGESWLSNVNFEPREFPEQRPDETDREYAEHEMRVDERLFMVGLIKAESQGPDGMVEALNAPDFRVKRSQRREFMEAIGKMSEEEYGTRVNNILGVFGNDEARQTAMDIADYYWLSAKKQARDLAALDEVIAEENAVSRTHHEKPRKYRWQVEEKPEMPRSQAEVMLANPQKYYREQKQERRGKKLFDKIKGVFGKFKKEEKVPRRARSGVDSSDFSDESLVPTPQLGAAVREDGSRLQHHEDVDFYRGGEEFASSMAADGYPEPVPAGRLFKDTNFYHETPAGHYFGGGESASREKEQKDRRRENLSSARFDGLSGFSDNGAL